MPRARAVHMQRYTLIEPDAPACNGKAREWSTTNDPTAVSCQRCRMSETYKVAKAAALHDKLTPEQIADIAGDADDHQPEATT